ncbi:MAG: nucleotidyltransferase family protein [Acidimicrobiales bacterium]|jgi:hypothetical protein
MTDTSTWATAVAAYGLGPPHEVLSGGPVDESTWPRLLELARNQRLVGLVRSAAQDGVLALSANQWTRLEQVHNDVVEETARAELSTASISGFLEEAGIDSRLLKGPAFAHLDYRSPAIRPFVEANLLVRSSQFVEAISLLKQRGFNRTHAEPAPGFDSRFRKGSILTSDSGERVEVHRTIADGPYAMIVEHSELFRNSSEIRVAGKDLLTLGAEERLLHACFEARVGDTRPLLIRLRDIVQIVLTHDLDIGRIEALSGTWGAQSLVAEAIDRAWNLLGVTDIVPLSAWAAKHPTSRKERRRLLAYHTARSRTLISVQTLGSIRPRRAVVSYLKTVALPDRAYLEGYYSGHFSRWWNVMRSMNSIGTKQRPARDRLAHASEDELVELAWGLARNPSPA